MLDSDSSDDLMSGTSGGINGDRGWQTMSTSHAWTILLLVLVSILSGVANNFSRGFKVADRVSFLVG